jgi:hypothetical protein
MQPKRCPVFVDGKECGRELTEVDLEAKELTRYDLVVCECSLGHRSYFFERAKTSKHILGLI